MRHRDSSISAPLWHRRLTRTAQAGANLRRIRQPPDLTPDQEKKMLKHNRLSRTSSLCLSILASSTLALAAGCGDDDTSSGGTDGQDGVDGENGQNGKDGENGQDGQDGQGGQDGQDGENGDPGEDGDPGENGDPGYGINRLKFAPVAFPETDLEKHSILASESAKVSGTEVTIGYNTMLRGNQDPAGTNMACDLANSPETCFGTLMDQNGAAITDSNGDEDVAASADYTSLTTGADGKLYAITHFESRPGGMYATELTQGTDGTLTPVSTKAVDFSGVDGLWVPCAGSTTPWGTHLGSEEYPPNARLYQEATTVDDVSSYDVPMYRYFGLDIYTDTSPADGVPDDLATWSDVTDVFNPYAYGYPVEVSIDASGDPQVEKHYAMGRVALELAYVMPDQKTVYLTDDGTNVGLYMFVATTAGDLSEGELFAMKWYQTSPVGEGAGEADLEWISLGSATWSEVDAMLHGSGKLAFDDIFDTETPSGDTCPTSGFVPVAYGSQSVECIQLKSGMEKAASRLETGRYAAYLGATTEFRKEEGITYDRDGYRLFLAMSQVARGMSDGIGDIQVAGNNCGVVYALDIAPSDATGSDYTAVNIYPYVEGTPISYPSGSIYENNSCSVNGIASPDNVTFVTGYNTLIIGEDTSAHQNDMIWAYDTIDNTLTRIQTTPFGSETTSPYWYPNVNGNAYMSSVVQHPYGESDESRVTDTDATGPEAWVGFIGPFPAMD